MELNKVWFNLTRIRNGWLVKYATFSSDGVELQSEETYFEILGEVKDFMSLHTRKNGLRIKSYGITALYRELDVGERGTSE